MCYFIGVYRSRIPFKMSEMWYCCSVFQCICIIYKPYLSIFMPWTVLCCVAISRNWSTELCDCVVSYCVSFRTTESALFLYSGSDLESPFANTVLYVFSLRFLAQCLLTGSRKKNTHNNVLLWCVFDICTVSRLDIFLTPLFLLSWGNCVK